MSILVVLAGFASHRRHRDQPAAGAGLFWVFFFRTRSTRHLSSQIFQYKSTHTIHPQSVSSLRWSSRSLAWRRTRAGRNSQVLLACGRMSQLERTSR